MADSIRAQNSDGIPAAEQIESMQLRMLLKPTVLPFLRVRGTNAAQPRRGEMFNAKSQANSRSATAHKGRRFST